MMELKIRNYKTLAILTVLLMTSVLRAAAEQGKAGDDVAWKLDNGLLTITGINTGIMDDYDDNHPAPWYNYHDKISVVVIGDGVTHIGDCAFYSGINAYRSLHSVYIGEDVTSIGEDAFYGAHALKRVSISAGTGSLFVKDDAFTGCNAVTDIFCGAQPFETWESADVAFSDRTVLHVKDLLYSAWNIQWGSNKSRLKILGDLNDYVGYDMDKPIVASYDSETKKLTIRMKTKELPDNAAYHYWNNQRENIEHVVFEMLDGAVLTGIGDAAFSGMTNLKSIEIPNTVEYIGFEAFCGCVNLSNIGIPPSTVSVPENLITIGGRAFSGCNALTSIAIMNNVNYIGYMAFSNCSNLESIRFYREGEIGFAPFVFADCSKLKYFTYCPAEVKEIPTGMFSYCTSLENFTCPDNVETIGEVAFEGCTHLNYVKLNNKLERIEASAFLNCSNLRADKRNATALTIPASVKYIGSEDAQYSRGAFTGCTSLKELNLKPNPTTLEWYGYVHDFDSETTLACHVDNVSNLLAWGKNYHDKLNADFDMALNAVAPGDGTCWSSLYCPPIEGDDRLALTASYLDGEELDFTPDIYVAKVEDDNVMVKNTGSLYIPQGQAVILHGESAHLSETGAKFILTYQDGYYGIDEGTTSGNQLLGSTTAVEQESGYIYYALAKYKDSDNKEHVNFQYVPSNIRIPAYKAYLRVPQTVSFANEFNFVVEETTGISTQQSFSSPLDPRSDECSTLDSGWYTLDGRLLNGKPTAKGIYINKGRKIFVK